MEIKKYLCDIGKDVQSDFYLDYSYAKKYNYEKQVELENRFDNWKSLVLEFLSQVLQDESVFNKFVFLFSLIEKSEYEKKAFETVISELTNLKIMDNVNPSEPAQQPVRQIETNNMTSKKVFIVHGHNSVVRDQVKEFIHEIGYAPIILQNLPNEGRTIIEKLEKETDVAYAIILYTGCDRGSINDENAELKPRARQNVIFEHGYLFAKLGRKKVCALYQEGVEYPSDLSGVLYQPYFDHNKSWKVNLAKEMIKAGLIINLEDINVNN